MRASSKAGGLVVALLLLSGCGVTENMTEACQPERQSYEWSARFATGLAARGVSPTSPTAKRAAERLAAARDRLGACEVMNGRG